MSEKQAKKVFLKQAKPFFRRYETERARKNPGRNNTRRATLDFKAKIHAWAGAIKIPFLEASFHDVVRGPVSLRVPILFTLPVGFERGFKFTSESEFDNFKKFCEDK